MTYGIEVEFMTDTVKKRVEKALEEIKAKVADVSVSLASKMLEKSISPEDHRELINNAIKELD